MTKVEQHEKICKTLTDTYAKKNADYGDSWTKSINEWGLAAAGVRISDKYNRMIKLLQGADPKVKNEGLDDVCLDMANYCIMLYMYLQNRGE